MSPKKSRLLSLTLPFLILLAGGLGFLALKGLKKQPPKRPTKVQGPLVEVLTVHPVDQQITISATGTVQAWQEVEIVPQVAGKVVWVSPKLVAGGHFARGEILFQIEKKDYEIALEAAEAKVAKAEEALALAKNKALVARRQWQRLYGEKSPPSDLVFYEPQVKTAQAELKAALAAKEKATLDLARTTVRAPFDCLVVEEHVDLGYYVTPGAPVAKVVGTKKAEVVAPIPLRDLSWLQIPAPCEVKLSAGSRVFTYQGQAVRFLPRVEKTGRLPQLVVEVPDPYQMKKRLPGRPDLAEGLFVELVIRGKVARGVYALPREVIRRGDTVWLVNQDSRLEIRPVKVIFRERDRVLVRGLRPGERVIVTKLEAAAPGLKVRVYQGEQ